MIYDAHIHLWPSLEKEHNPKDFLLSTPEKNKIGGMIISLPPPKYGAYDNLGVKPMSNPKRIQHTLDFCKPLKNFFPCYWIDPTDKDAVKQVVKVKELGFRAIKVICTHYFPSAGMAVYHKCAELNLPVLFHSGISFDGQDSSRYSHPLEFECLLEVMTLRFAMAHLSWPWCDDFVAFYGKVYAKRLYNKRCHIQLFADMTRGTPDNYREEALRKLLFTGYPIEDFLLFGTDTMVPNVDANRIRGVYDRDVAIFALLKKFAKSVKEDETAPVQFRDAASQDVDKIFKKATEKNFLRFLNGDQ